MYDKDDKYAFNKEIAYSEHTISQYIHILPIVSNTKGVGLITLDGEVVLFEHSDALLSESE